MPIQNSRSRKRLERESIMEAEAAVHTSSNGALAHAPAPIPDMAQGRAESIGLSKLMERRDKMAQGLNSISAELEAAEQRVEDLKTSKARTQGALIILNQLCEELDPTALQAAQQGG